MPSESEMLIIIVNPWEAYLETDGVQEKDEELAYEIICAAGPNIATANLHH